MKLAQILCESDQGLTLHIPKKSLALLSPLAATSMTCMSFFYLFFFFVLLDKYIFACLGPWVMLIIYASDDLRQELWESCDIR